MQISKWQKEGKLELIEKGEPVVEIQAHLERVAKALEVLKKAGYNSNVMKSWILQDTKLSHGRINAVLSSQEEFFRQIGVIPKGR
jgi:precorrin-6B methylase 2